MKHLPDFYPIVQKDEVIMPETKSFLGRIYDGSIGAMMSTLVKQGDLSEKDIDELEEILKNARENAEKKG